jgi:TatD DNase family protein
MRLFDTHCHLDDEQFDANRAEVVERAVAAGVVGMVAVGTTVLSSRKCLELAGQFDPVRAAVGIQPNHAAEAESGDWDQITRLARDPRAVALGETGLDAYWNDTPFNVQQDYFQRHLALSAATGLPFIVHMRDCEAELLEMLRDARRAGPLRGVMHSFTGGESTARECLELGLYISFAGMVTYKKSDDLRQVAASVPLDRLLIETDAPYLSPHPKRGQRPNEPALVIHTAACLADVQGVALDVLCDHTTQNAFRLFLQSDTE